MSSCLCQFFHQILYSVLYVALCSIEQKLNDLSGNNKEMNVKCLCEEHEKDEYTFPCFDEVNQFVSILIPFAILNSKRFRNDIFHQFWNNFLKSNKGLPADEIVNGIWKPAVNECSNILLLLENGHITIFEARKVFGSKEKTDNVTAIQKLHCAFLAFDTISWSELAQSTDINDIERIISSKANNLNHLQWIERTTSIISEWSGVDKLSDVADSVLSILEGLEITLPEKDIVNLEAFSSKVHQ